MRPVFFDFETHLIRPGCLMPRAVCLSFAERVEEYGPERLTKLDELRAKFPEAQIDIIEDISTTTKINRGTFYAGLMLRKDAPLFLFGLLTDPDVVIVGHNVTFDLAVAVRADATLLRLVFEKYRDGGIMDTMTRQKLIDVAAGEMKFHVDEDGEPKKTSYDLAALALRLLDKRVSKKDTWRLKYGLLDGVPIAEWPEEARTYSVGDAITTGEIFFKQEEICGAPIPNSAEQHRAAWGLHLMSCYGIRTDGEAVSALKKTLEADYAQRMAELTTAPVAALPEVGTPAALPPVVGAALAAVPKSETGLAPSTDSATKELPWTLLFTITPARVLKSGPRKGQTEPQKIAKNQKAIRERVVAAYLLKGVAVEDVPKSDSGQISMAKKTLAESGDPWLKKLAEVGGVAKLLETYVPILESGTRFPINPRYNELVETGRTSCSKPNIQNPPRAGGVRECFVARPGCVYAFSDYDTLELRALAQVCLDVLGYSNMAEALRRGEDLHLALAAKMLGISLEEAARRMEEGDAEVKEYRQQSKPANFGFPGGMAAESFREYAEGYGIKLTSEKATWIHETWKSQWSEMEDYFAWVSQLVENYSSVEQIRSGRIRGGASFCAAANGFFQGLAADGAKEAIWNVAWECYVDESSPMFGCRPVFFIHDEIGMEIPYDRFGRERSAKAAARLSEVMIASMKKWIPDIPISCKPVMVRRWYKGAEQVKIDGVLVPSKPVVTKVDGKKKTSWVADT